jgi:putative glutamine amidotransferase
MFKETTSNIRIGIYGQEEPGSDEPRGFALWPIGYSGTITAAEAVPVFLPEKTPDLSWKEILHDIDGVVLTRFHDPSPTESADEEELARFCRQHQIPFLGIDQGLQILNTAFGGTLYLDLSRELPEALQHRHPPEKGLRHAINVVRETYLADLYGEGEVAVNSEHRRGINRLARGFRVSATALDSVVEAIEFEGDRWYAMGVQWRPASASASGLDIQVFRGVINACQKKTQTPASEVSFEAA